MIDNSWNISGKANPYAKSSNSWATDSPQKANKKVGEIHQGYDKSNAANSMIVQRSGMVSSSNPMS